MRYLHKYDSFNEGKITQFFIRNIAKITGSITILIKKIKGTYIPFKFKDKKLEKKIAKKIVELLDYTTFNIRSYLKERIKKGTEGVVTYSEYLKDKRGFDTYKEFDFIMDNLVEKNLVLSDNMKKEQLEKLEKGRKIVKDIVATVKLMDDEYIEEQKLIKYLESIEKDLEVMMKLRSAFGEEKNINTDNILKHVRSKKDKNIDDILDKVKKYGEKSLTKHEKDLLSKSAKK